MTLSLSRSDLPRSSDTFHLPRGMYGFMNMLFILLALQTTAADLPATRLDRFQLLEYQDAGGSIKKVETAADWQRRRAAIVHAMQTVMGPFPDSARRVPLDVVVEEEVDAGSYVRRLITYQSEPDSRTPAYLCVPKKALAGQAKVPAVLCLHPTDNNIGHQVAVGLGGRPGRAYGAELAERGYVTLSPSYPLLAKYWPNLPLLGYQSGTMKAIWDNSRGVDLLLSLPFVDGRQGCGAIGHSLGGHNALYTAVFEPRVSVVVTSCGFDSYRDYYGGAERSWYFERGWCQLRYMPRLADYRGRLEEIPFDFAEILGAIAPRPIYVNAPLHDSNFVWQSVDRCVAAAQPIYQLLGAPNALTVEHPDIDHNFPDAQREAAYRTLQQVLQPQ